SPPERSRSNAQQDRRLFVHGGGQAVRWPAGFRFEAFDEVLMLRYTTTMDAVLSLLQAETGAPRVQNGPRRNRQAHSRSRRVWVFRRRTGHASPADSRTGHEDRAPASDRAASRNRRAAPAEARASIRVRTAPPDGFAHDEFHRRRRSRRSRAPRTPTAARA